ncbi:MAG: hypothetical protein Q7P63_11990 [Verrucomicrobiota bacterium JB022]|nr:hypothetical protein [Verrucomicrobiota bacterium JB022]
MLAQSLAFPLLAAWQANPTFNAVVEVILTSLGVLELIAVAAWFGFSIARLRARHWSNTFWNIMVVGSGILLFIQVALTVVFTWWGLRTSQDQYEITLQTREELAAGHVTSLDRQVRLSVPPGYIALSDEGKYTLHLQLQNAILEMTLASNVKAEMGLDLQSYADYEVRRLQEGGDPIELVSSEATVVNGLPAIRQRFLMDYSGFRQVYLQAVIEGPEEYYQLVLKTIPGLETSAVEHFERMLEEFEVVEK